MLAKSLGNVKNMLKQSWRAAAFSTYEKTFMADDLIFKERKVLKQKPGPDHQYTFGGITTDYMLEINYDRENGGW